MSTNKKFETEEKTMQQQHISLLGKKCTDKVTGFNGVITTIAFDLYGCIQAIVTPPVDDKGAMAEGRWFDVGRLEIQTTTTVMPPPNFTRGYIALGRKGAAEKPLPPA